MVVFLLGAAGVVFALVYHGERNLQRVEVEGIESPGERQDDIELDIDEIDDVLHVLVAGSDRREGLDAEARRKLGTGEADGDRTDTIMLLRLDPSTEEVGILSIPRDLLVTRCDGSRGKINAAYQIGERDGTGGASCLVQTINDMSGLSIHHFVQVDFAGFLDLVDLVDGVTVYLEEPIDDPLAHLDLEAGCHRLAGVDALGFVRHRASDSDYGRIARQQRFIKELVRESSRLDTIVNVPKLFQMVEAGASAVTTDQNLTLDKMRRIAFTLRNVDTENMVARTIPADYQRMDGIDFEIPREEESESLYRAFETGRLGEQPPDESEDGEGSGEDGEGSGEGGDGSGEGSGEDGEGPGEAGDGSGEGADRAQDRDAGDGAQDRDAGDSAQDRDGGSADGDSAGDDRMGASADDGGEASAEGANDEHVVAPPADERTFVGAQEPPEHCR